MSELCEDNNEYDVIINKMKLTEGIDIRTCVLLPNHCFIQDVPEHFPVYDFVQHLQRIAYLADLFHSAFFIEETSLSYFHVFIILSFSLFV